jgi:hypothetical protein
MKFTLTPSHAITLTRAPNDWEKLPDNTCTTALRLAGLIDIRDAPGERTLARGFQWRITLTGARLQQRKVRPAHEVVTAPKAIGPEVSKTKRLRAKRAVMAITERLQETLGIRPTLRRRPQRVHSPSTDVESIA